MSKSIISVQEKIVLQHSSIIEGTLTHGGLENRKFFNLSPRDLAAHPALSLIMIAAMPPPSGVVMTNAAEGAPWSETVPVKRAE